MVFRPSADTALFSAALAAEGKVQSSTISLSLNFGLTTARLPGFTDRRSPKTENLPDKLPSSPSLFADY